MLIPKDLFAPKFVQDPDFPSGVVYGRLRLAHGFRRQKRQQEAGAVGAIPSYVQYLLYARSNILSRAA
jgi:hypothetical protein